jgi:myo-inositol-1-phosphate synthase
VRINYYPPRGDNKEGWDNIDLVGWLGIRCSSRSISSAATASWRRRSSSTSRCSSIWRDASGFTGIQEWLSFYFKSPMHAPGLYPEHDLFIQSMKLKNTLRYIRGEELITHLGREYYD